MSGPKPVDVEVCGNCGQVTLLLFLVTTWSGPVLVAHCGECDAGHCPQCRGYTSGRGTGGRERFCSECGAGLALG